MGRLLCRERRSFARWQHWPLIPNALGRRQWQLIAAGECLLIARWLAQFAAHRWVSYGDVTAPRYDVIYHSWRQQTTVRTGMTTTVKITITTATVMMMMIIMMTRQWILIINELWSTKWTVLIRVIDHSTTWTWEGVGQWRRLEDSKFWSFWFVLIWKNFLCSAFDTSLSVTNNSLTYSILDCVRVLSFDWNYLFTLQLNLLVRPTAFSGILFNLSQTNIVLRWAHE